VFILDSSPSMAQCLITGHETSEDERNLEDQSSGCSDGSTGDTTVHPEVSRLSCAKEAIEKMVCDLILRSKSNECGVIVLKTAKTRHHFASEEQVEEGTAPFPNITELSEVTKPTVDLLKAIREVRALSKSEDEDNGVRGDICDGIIVAANALYRRTSGKKYIRKLVLFTDAEHEVMVDTDQIISVVEGLKKMECSLTVIGLDFDHSAYFEKPVEDLEDEHIDEQDGNEHEESDYETENGSDSDETGDGEECHGKSVCKSVIKHENEKLLVSLAKLTGGSVIAASTLREMLESTAGKRIPRSTRKNIEFVVAPSVSLRARFSLLLSQAKIPTLKREAVILEPDGTIAKNGAGDDMSSAVTNSTSHWDVDNDGVEVPIHQRTQAFKYGSDLIPIGTFDLEGLKMRSPVSLEIKGYVSANTIPRSLQIGPPYVVSGEGRKACTVISALAEALHRLEHVAICRLVKSKDADPIIGALYPLTGDYNEDREEQSVPNPHRLFYVQIPFAGDLQALSMSPFEETSDIEEETVCDTLIDSLMLPKDSLRSNRIANPAIRAFNNTVTNRALDESSGIVNSRRVRRGTSESMSTPVGLLKNAETQCQRFREIFPTIDKEDSKSQRIGARF